MVLLSKIKYVLTTVFICILLSVIGYALPTNTIFKQHVAKSAYILDGEGTYPKVLSLYNSQLDNFTDALMINIAAYDGGESLLTKLSSNYRYKTSQESSISWLLTAYSKHDEPISVAPYRDVYKRQGIYSNYQLILNAVKNVLKQFFLSISASVGNLGVTESSEKKELIFNVTLLLANWLYGLCSICIFNLINPFINLWLGKDLTFDKRVVFVLCLNLYIYGIRQPLQTFWESFGLFWYDRYKPCLLYTSRCV